ncbi:MAG: MBL fold metallo-hydrolase [Acidobacteriota bacterium]
MSKTMSVLAALTLPFCGYAQPSQLEAARLTAGTTWQPAYNFFCVAPKANSADDPPIQPTKIFDNLYAIGDSGTTAYALATPDGIILLDSLPANQTETVLVPGMKALGLDPANVKYVVVTHGHGDHSGGSFYFQERYGAHVVLSAADWDLLQPQNGKGKASANAPRRDIVATEDQPVTLGDVKIAMVMTPGHTPGSMGLIFPVKDGASTHMAAMFGGTILLPQRPDVATLQTYLKSIEHFRAAAARAQVDVEIQNHPLMDAMQDRLAAVRSRRTGTPHPYVAGAENYLKFLDVMAGCLRAQRADIP